MDQPLWTLRTFWNFEIHHTSGLQLVDFNVLKNHVVKTRHKRGIDSKQQMRLSPAMPRRVATDSGAAPRCGPPPAPGYADPTGTPPQGAPAGVRTNPPAAAHPRYSMYL